MKNMPVKFMIKKQKRRIQARKMQSGQILIIVVFAIVGLVAFVGLVVDTGLVFIGNGKLRRATDAAALAAASEYRKDPNPVGLSAAAKEFLVLNKIEDPNATVYVCNPDPAFVQFYDASLCTTPARRRLVKVNAQTTVGLAFLPVLGIRSVTLNATATSEAAALDIVFAIDVSESMTQDEPQFALMRDPAECNDVPSVTDLTNCHPFRDIQQAAMDFVQGLFPANGSNQYDRVSIIPFDRNAHHTTTGLYNDPLYLGDQASYTPINYRQKILNELAGLRVFNASGSSSSGGPLTNGSCLDATGNLTFPSDPSNEPQSPCRNYVGNSDPFCFEQPVSTDPPHWAGYSQVPQDESVFNDNRCFTATPVGSPHQGPFIRPSDGMHFERAYLDFACPPLADFSHCPGTTNTGGAFLASGSEFVRQPGFRQESLWIVILLTDGKADHSNGNLNCPNGTGADCQDTSVKSFNAGTRYCLPANSTVYASDPILYSTCMGVPAAPPGGTGGIQTTDQIDPNSLYDADDYARDMADFVALGQQALVYTIGFGNALDHMPNGNPNSSGEQLLNYAADIGDDGKVDTPNGQLNSDYFYAHTAADLAQIFQTISDRISTRLTH
jgi:hypothetical protein